ncbi:variable large family protein [Borrelia miyamotoi]|uniref:Variable large protein n=1 Tax=Borrelia miyamotoi TaxID=47466 RepID=A0AAQ2WWM2_9SPIR|nr:variable large family protein [Borrelia miyamotoi]AOW96302.1 Variable large protein 15/16 [Borrelia miyamotoi]QTL84149.1 variable large family protein [Borrelia miyamotoi]QTL84164.1 variable large family protein [Borrelia miyamotoi]QTL84359.1 variable large family protein [Borrelia miyamotoi]WAZ85812.1 variable large family protein [Borrelia miyamotoi]
MTLFLIIGCNNGGGEDPQKVFLTSIANLGKGFLDVFVTFGDMVTGAFGIKAETKKSDVGKYFTSIAETMESVKKKLQDEVAKNGNYEKVKTVVDKFITGTLDKIAEGAKKAASGAISSDAIGNAVKNEDAVPADATSVNALIKGIKTIVDVVLKEDEGDPTATKTGDTEQKSIGKFFGEKSNGATDTQAAAASASIGVVTGADILKAIASAEEAKGEPTIEQAKNAAEIAIAKKEDNKDLNAAKKDAVIAAGIALRAMAKDGKFAAKNEDKAAPAVNGAAASAVGKTLSTLIIAIRNTVDSGLKNINKVLATVKQEDKSAEATNTVGSTASAQN